MTTRRTLLGGAACCLLVGAPTVAGAQPAQRLRRIGYIGNFPPGVSAEADRLFAQFVRWIGERGHVEGRNVVFERRAIAGHPDRVPALVAELVGMPVDVLVINGASGAVRIAMKATATIPIVFMGAADPVASKLVDTLARPGGNVTGISSVNSEMVLKRIELIKAALPQAARIALITHDSGMFDQAAFETTRRAQDAAVRALGIRLIRFDMDAREDFDRTTAAIERERPDALVIAGSATAVVLYREIAEFAIRIKLPLIAGARAEAAAGALLAYGANFEETFYRAALYVARILDGAKPADLPIEQPTRLELVVNLKTARRIGITLPASLLLRADEVIDS